MKKSLIFKTLYLLLIIAVVAGVSVFATTTYLASQVSYGSTNVENALNDLYTLKGNDENYSTEEKRIGTWIDGKPLYRKVYPNVEIEITNAGTWVDIIDISKLNVETLVNSNQLRNDNVEFKDIWFKAISGKLAATVYNRTTKGVFYVWIEYTKTTD